MDQMTVNGAIELFKKTVTEHYTDFNGRVGRQDFWTYVAVALVLAIVVGIVGGIIGLPILSQLLSLGLILPNAGMAVRRLHDIGKNGTPVVALAGLAVLSNVIGVMTSLMFGTFGAGYAILSFGPLRGLIGLGLLALGIYIIYLCAQPGVAGPNEYGPDPKTTA